MPPIRKPMERAYVFPSTYIGIDPGMNGAITSIRSNGEMETLSLENKPFAAIHGFLSDKESTTMSIYAVIEQQSPRPTMVYLPGEGFRPRILRSTVVLYGSYMELRAIALSLGIKLREVIPKKWQDYYDLHREKSEKETEWKRRIRRKSEEHFPDVKMTNKTADSFLIADYCRQMQEQWSDRWFNAGS